MFTCYVQDYRLRGNPDEWCNMYTGGLQSGRCNKYRPPTFSPPYFSDSPPISVKSKKISEKSEILKNDLNHWKGDGCSLADHEVRPNEGLIFWTISVSRSFGWPLMSALRRADVSMKVWLFRWYGPPFEWLTTKQQPFVGLTCICSAIHMADSGQPYKRLTV